MDREQIESMIIALRIIGYRYDQKSSNHGRFIFRNSYGRSVIVQDWKCFDDWISHYEFRDKVQAERVEFVLHPERFELVK